MSTRPCPVRRRGVSAPRAQRMPSRPLRTRVQPAARVGWRPRAVPDPVLQPRR
jgi:hypothetical protein